MMFQVMDAATSQQWMLTSASSAAEVEFRELAFSELPEWFRVIYPKDSMISMLNSVQLQIAEQHPAYMASKNILFRVWIEIKLILMISSVKLIKLLISPNIKKEVGMYNFQMAQRREKQAQLHTLTQRKEQHWLKRYKTQIKPKLLAQYDVRLKAFMRQVEQQPQDPSRIVKSSINQHFPPFKFKLYETYGLKDKKSHHQQFFQTKQDCSILRSSGYNPISDYQFRQRQKEKEIRPTVNIKNLIFRKKQKQQYLISIEKVKSRETMRTNRQSTAQERKKSREDNRSEINSMYDENQSIRNSANQNIEKEARQYQKKHEFVERKRHYKKLVNLEQTLQDPITRRVIHGLLVKGGQKRPRIKTQYDSAQADLFNIETDKLLKE